MNVAADVQLLQELEAALAAGLETIDATQWTAFELSTAFDDLLNLSRGKDAMYDRPSIGWLYASWYQARRLHDALRLLTPALDAATRPIRVVDFGAGTGATLWAVAAYNRRRVINGLPVRSVIYSGIESSNPMLRVGRALAETLFNGSTFAGTVEEWAFTIGNWCDAPVQGSEDHDTIVTACYLLDDSDRERAGDIVTLLARQAVAADASTLAVTTTKAKIGTVHAIEHSDAWEAYPAQNLGAAWTGSLREIQRLRGTVLTNVAQYRSFTAAPSWASDEGESRTFQRTRSGRLFDLPAQRSLTLDDDQDRAAEPDGRMTAIIGAAGSGKSRVLVERVARTLDRRPASDGPAHTLVATFNRSMVEQLGIWLRERLDVGMSMSWEEVADPFFEEFSIFKHAVSGSEIHVRTWDSALKRSLGLTGAASSITEDKLNARLTSLGVDANALPPSLRSVCNARFIEAEFRRVIFGLDAGSDPETYFAIERAGRRAPLTRAQRELVWSIAMANPPEWRTWTHQRLAALHAVRSLQEPPYRFAFIDECQDMTPADFEIAARLVPDPNDITVAGDEAQALHIGTSYRRIRSVLRFRAQGGGEQFRRWQQHSLLGSYRLPLRICEAVQPLADAIASTRAPLTSDHDVVTPSVRRGAVLGCRPIVLSRTAIRDTYHSAINTHWDVLSSVDRRSRIVTFAESPAPFELKTSELPPGYILRAETMRAIKGLERGIVCWATWNEFNTHEAVDEWIYTILTRTCGLAFILVDSEETTDEAAMAISRLRRDRLSPWDEDAAAELEAVVERGERLRGD